MADVTLLEKVTNVTQAGSPRGDAFSTFILKNKEFNDPLHQQTTLSFKHILFTQFFATHFFHRAVFHHATYLRVSHNLSSPST